MQHKNNTGDNIKPRHLNISFFTNKYNVSIGWNRMNCKNVSIKSQI